MSAPIVLEIKPPATIATENVKAALLEWVEKLDDLKIIGATFVMVSTDSSVHVQNVTDRSLTQKSHWFVLAALIWLKKWQ